MFGNLFGKKKTAKGQVNLEYDFFFFLGGLRRYAEQAVQRLNSRAQRNTSQQYRILYNGIFVAEFLAYIVFWHRFCALRHSKSSTPLIDEQDRQIRSCIDQLLAEAPKDKRRLLGDHYSKIINDRFSDYGEFQISTPPELFERQRVQECQKLFQYLLRKSEAESLAADIGSDPMICMFVAQIGMTITKRYEGAIR